MSDEQRSRYGIATCSHYGKPDDFRLGLALETIGLAKAAGIPFITTDSSSEDVQEILRAAGAVVIPGEGLTYGEKRRLALKYVLDDDMIAVIMEPEKSTLVPFLDDLVWAVVCGADMVIPWRRSMDSYPSYQKILEPYCNWQAHGLMGGDTMYDLWNGIRVVRAGLAAQAILDYRGEYGTDFWDSMYVPVVQALHAGAKIASVPIDYVHPASQKEAEEGGAAMDKKRDAQRDTILKSIGDVCKDLGLTPA